MTKNDDSPTLFSISGKDGGGGGYGGHYDSDGHLQGM